MKRGEIHLVELEPTLGVEQQGRRPCLVLTSKSFNARGIAWVCPISSGGGFARQAGFAVSLASSGLATTGVVLCHQMRAVTIKERFLKRIETAPDFIVDEVWAKVQAILEDED
jgi:mRNA interferase ChpB